jgi:signal transduction histidine kinase
MVKAGLSKKITMILIIVSLVSVLITAVPMLMMTRQQFSNYIDQYDQAILAQWLPVVSETYAQNGASGLLDLLESNTMGGGLGNGKGNGMGMRRGIAAGMGMKQGQRLVVTDMKGTVLADSQGVLLGQQASFDPADVSSAPLINNQQQIGTLYVISPLGSGLASLENDFITSLTGSTFILAFLMAIIALLLGLTLGKRISAPLGALSTAIHNVARGRLDQRLDLQGDEEFEQLGRDFNLMAQNLENADQNRRRMTADVSHELRTPLTFLRGQLEEMQNGNVPADAENISLLLDEVIRLSRLVKELDNLALVENHAVKLNLSTFPVNELLERLTPVKIAMQDKGINYRIEVDKDIQNINADLDRLLQILLNLLSNAMQHTGENGTVKLTVRRLKESLQFSVINNGPGIPADNLPYIFERFYRVDDSRNRRAGGMGLGLAIAKGYAEAHHGRMWVESNTNETTFFFTIAP